MNSEQAGRGVAGMRHARGEALSHGEQTSPGLHLKGLTVGYRDGRRRRAVLRDLTASARRGELTALIGPNGTGKTTLLRTIAGLQAPFDGSIRLSGRCLDRLSAAERAHHQAIVLTERVAPGRLSAREMVALGRHPHTGLLGRLTSRDEQLVEEALAAVGASTLAERDIAELSDGERQRVMTARALAQQPRLLLMDEPSAFLDAPGRIALTGLIRRVAFDQDVVAVVSTHEVELALHVADHIWLLDRGGRLHTGTPEQLVVAGHLGAVFDSEDLVFDAARGSFILIGNDTGTARVTGNASPVLDRLLTRRGWRHDDGAVDLEIRVVGPTTWDMLAGGQSRQVDGFEDLSRALSTTIDTHGLRRIEHEPVRRTAAAIARHGPYFCFDSLDQRAVPLSEMTGERLLAWAKTTCQRLGTGELRVGASTWQFGLVARIWSLTIGCWAHDGIVPDLDGLMLVDDLNNPAMAFVPTAGWLDEDAPVTAVAEMMVDHVRALTDPLHTRLRAQVHIASGLLQGNQAAAAIGAVRAVQRHPQQRRDLEPILAALLQTPTVSDHIEPAHTAEGGAALRRRSCCLYYRAPGGGTCDDCPLGPTASRPRHQTAHALVEQSDQGRHP